MLLNFKNSQYALTVSDGDFDVLSPEVDDVERLVFDDCYSPYKAWLTVLGVPKEQLPALLGLEQCEAMKYWTDAHSSPDVLYVKNFCNRLGIHPAYLQPALREERYHFHYHPSILDAICDVIKDPNATLEDKNLSIIALQIERKKYIDFAAAHPSKASYFQEAVAYAEKLKLAAQILDMSHDFNAAVQNNEMHIVDHALDFYHTYLRNQSMSAEAMNLEMSFQADDYYQQLYDGAAVLYGDEFTTQSLQMILDNIVDGVLPGQFFSEEDAEFYKDDIFVNLEDCLQNRNDMQMPLLRGDLNDMFDPNSEALALFKGHVMRSLRQFINAKLTIDLAARNSLMTHARVTEYECWLHSADTKHYEIPLYKNYCQAEYHLKRSSQIQGVDFNSVIAVHWG